jgi:hypothetical protein
LKNLSLYKKFPNKINGIFALAAQELRHIGTYRKIQHFAATSGADATLKNADVYLSGVYFHRICSIIQMLMLKLFFSVLEMIKQKKHTWITRLNKKVGF